MNRWKALSRCADEELKADGAPAGRARLSDLLSPREWSAEGFGGEGGFESGLDVVTMKGAVQLAVSAGTGL